MEGLEAVEISFNQLKANNHSFRFDSEYLKKIYLKNIEKIKCYSEGFFKLGDYAKEITGGATPLGADYPEEGIPFLRVQNIMQNYFSLDDIVYIKSEDDQQLKRSRLKLNDVLLTITGVSYGKSAIVTPEVVGSNINQHSVKITLNASVINPYFLSTFLNSKFGKLQSDQNVVGVTRPILLP